MKMQMEAIATTKAQGNARFKAGDFIAAKQLYSDAIDAAERLGTQEHDAALRQLLAQAHCNRAAVHLKLGETHEAATDAAHAAQRMPQWGKPHVRLAEAAAAQRQFQDALASLATALRLAQAEGDRAVVQQVETLQTEYKVWRQCQAHDAATGFSSEDALRTMLGAIDRGARTFSSHTLVDGRLEPATAMEDLRPDELYDHARCLEDEQEDVEGALRLYEQIAKIPVDPTRGWHWNRGIGDALAALGRHYNEATQYAKNDALAVDYMTRGAALGSADAWNDLGVMCVEGTHGQSRDLARAKDYFRRGAELQHPMAMLNLGKLHMTLREVAMATRWAEAAARLGVLQGYDDARTYREAAKEIQTLTPEVQQLLEDVASFRACPGYVQIHLNHRPTPTVAQLRAVKTYYCRRLLQAKKLMLHACASIARGELAVGVSLAAQAYKFDDAVLVVTTDEMRSCEGALQRLVEAGHRVDASLVHVLQPPSQSTDPTDAMDFWYSCHEQFPNDYRIATCAAIAHTFVDGEDEEEHELKSTPRTRPKMRTGLTLFRQALSILTTSHAHDPREVDPNELGFWFLGGLALYRAEENAAAKGMIEKFVEFAGVDGHRFGGEAHFVLGLIELFPDDKFDKASVASSVPVAAEHLRLGKELQQRLPAFLQPKNTSSNQQLLEATLRAASASEGIPLDSPATAASGSSMSDAVKSCGGDLLGGPSRHPKLPPPASILTDAWKRKRAEELATGVGATVNGGWPLSTMKKSARVVPRVDSNLRPITVDEIISGVDEQTYGGRILECVVIASIYKICASYHVIVEDSRRDPMQVVLRTASKTLMDQLVPGRVFSIRHPRLVHAEDESATLFVEDPAGDLDLGDVHLMCWNCSSASTTKEHHGKSCMQTCSQCHRAKYCSRECQKEDWKVYGHRLWCTPGLSKVAKSA